LIFTLFERVAQNFIGLSIQYNGLTIEEVNKIIDSVLKNSKFELLRLSSKGLNGEKITEIRGKLHKANPFMTLQIHDEVVHNIWALPC